MRSTKHKIHFHWNLRAQDHLKTWQGDKWVHKLEQTPQSMEMFVIAKQNLK